MKALALFLLVIATAYAEPEKYFQVPGQFAQAWQPSSNDVERALSSVREYCRVTLSDTVRDARLLQLTHEVEVIATNETITVVYDPPQYATNSIPVNFKVYGVAYSDYEKKIGSFIEKIPEGNIRFIAVQHLLDPKIRREVKRSRPFTVYHNIENGKTGLDTVSTWDKAESNGFDRVRVIYSPGPPYFISTAEF